MKGGVLAGLLLLCFGAQAQTSAAAPTYLVVDDGIPHALTGQPGDPVRGREIVTNRRVGLCLLCHSGPFAEERFQGNLAPDLAGSGARWNVAQLRLRMVDAAKLNPATIMPAYYRSDGLTDVGASWRGQTILSAQQIEDVVSFLATLRTEGNPPHASPVK